jgi:hypothetical protein
MLPWMLGHAPVLAAFFVMDILLPFILAGVVIGWIYRALTHQGENLYEGILHEYGFSTGLFWVVGLMVVSSVLSMAIRQMRHLAEKPSDFFRLPIFILVSTTFLMPVRLLGFFRLAHVAGWGTRAGAYTGGGQAEEAAATVVEAVPLPAPTPVPMITVGVGPRPEPASSPVALLERQTVLTATPSRPTRHRLNPYAAIPYLIGAAIFALEVFAIV